MGELWDVIVVGVADRTPQGVWRVAAEISRLSGLDPNAVQQAVVQGPVQVHAAMDAANATSSRNALQAAGAVVELRPAAHGFAAPTPATSDQGMTALGHRSHQGTQGGAGGDWAATLNDGAFGLDESALSALDGSPDVDASAHAPPPSQNMRSLEMDARFGGALAPGQRSVPMAPAAAPDPVVVPGTGDDHQLVAGAPNFDDERLELDLEGSGVQRRAPEEPTKEPEAPPSESSGATPLSEASGAAELPVLPEAARMYASPAPAPAERLLGSDPITVALLAACIGLWVGLLPAVKAAHGVERDEILPREEELARVLDRPLAVRAGKATAPEEIVVDLKEMHDGVRTRYYLTWLGVAIPVGVILAFIKRPGG